MSSVASAHALAGRGAAKAAARRRKRESDLESGQRRPGWVTYAILAAVVLISAYPLYFAFLLASSTAPEISRNPIPSLIPQGNLADNIARVFASVPFWPAIWNSVIVAVTP